MATSTGIDISAGIEFDANPDRAIWVEGELNQSLFDRLEPQLLAFTSQSADPVTIFVDSNGGDTAVCQRIIDLLSSGPIVTIACGHAESAAAHLLSLGDWAFAQPESKLLYHGSSVQGPQSLSAESASALAATLKNSNWTAVASLAHKSVRRFRSIISALRPSFEEHRAINVGAPTQADIERLAAILNRQEALGRRIAKWNVNHSERTDIECLTAILNGKLSDNGQQTLARTIFKWAAYQSLLCFFREEIERTKPSTSEDFERSMLNAAIGFNWPFEPNGSLHQIADDYAYLDACFEKVNRDQSNEFLEWCFFVSLCRALQEGENELTAADALWLGLIDTIRTDITTRRTMPPSSEGQSVRYHT